MIKHLVAWKLKDSAHGKTKAENAAHIKQMLEALNGKIAGMTKLEVGVDFSGTPDSYDLALYSEFVDRAALDGYMAHPDHKACFPYIGEASSSRMLVDYEV